MTMRIVTIAFGVLLIALGIGNYVVTGMSRIAALTPTLFGLFIGVLGFVALQNRSRGEHNHTLFGAIMLAVLGFLGSLGALWRLLTIMSSGQVVPPTAVIVQSIIGLSCVLFIILGLLLIKNFWQGWKAFGHFLGNLLARVVLTIFYFTVFVPFALGVKLFSDPLHIKKSPADFWRPRPTGDQTLEDIMRQY
jgi:hypothetical protein